MVCVFITAGQKISVQLLFFNFRCYFSFFPKIQAFDKIERERASERDGYKALHQPTPGQWPRCSLVGRCRPVVSALGCCSRQFRNGARLCNCRRLWTRLGEERARRLMCAGPFSHHAAPIPARPSGCAGTLGGRVVDVWLTQKSKCCRTHAVCCRICNWPSLPPSTHNVPLQMSTKCENMAHFIRYVASQKPRSPMARKSSLPDPTKPWMLTHCQRPFGGATVCCPSSLVQTHTHTHTFTHKYSLSHTHTHTHTHAVSGINALTTSRNQHIPQVSLSGRMRETSTSRGSLLRHVANATWKGLCGTA